VGRPGTCKGSAKESKTVSGISILGSLQIVFGQRQQKITVLEGIIGVQTKSHAKSCARGAVLFSSSVVTQHKECVCGAEVDACLAIQISGKMTEAKTLLRLEQGELEFASKVIAVCHPLFMTDH
jgi:hypothetical protein